MPAVLRFFLGAVVGLLLTGCESSRFVAEVTQFHELQATATPQTFVMVPADPAKAGSLEFKAYAGSVAAALGQQGYRLASAGQASDLVVLLDYAVGPGEIRSYPVPVYGYYPDQTTHISGIRRGNKRYSAHIYESGGFIPLGYTEATETLYERTLTLDIADAAAWRQGRTQKSYEGRVVSHGPESTIAAVMPLMIEALFIDFPGNNGASQTVVLEPES